MCRTLQASLFAALFVLSTSSLPAFAQTHNFWTSGAAMPTSLKYPMAGAIKGKIYVVGGITGSAVVADNQVYIPASNTWTSAAAIPAATEDGATAVLNNVLYVFGGSNDGKTVTNAVWAYTPATNKWSPKAAMPTARASAAAAVQNGKIYVIGGTDGQNRLTAVESYNPTNDSWTIEAPLPVGKSEPAAGLVKYSVNGVIVQRIVAADGYTASGDTGNNEAYNAANNSWSSLLADPNARNEACAAAKGAKLYLLGGSLGGLNSTNISESYDLPKNSWRTLVSMPHAATAPGSALSNGLLYCFGGGDNTLPFQGNVFNYVQIYHP
jgi:N-acetylneuraminic acid mutarotase